MFVEIVKIFTKIHAFASSAEVTFLIPESEKCDGTGLLGSLTVVSVVWHQESYLVCGNTATTIVKTFSQDFLGDHWLTWANAENSQGYQLPVCVLVVSWMYCGCVQSCIFETAEVYFSITCFHVMLHNHTLL